MTLGGEECESSSKVIGIARHRLQMDGQEVSL